MSLTAEDALHQHDIRCSLLAYLPVTYLTPRLSAFILSSQQQSARHFQHSYTTGITEKWHLTSYRWPNTNKTVVGIRLRPGTVLPPASRGPTTPTGNAHKIWRCRSLGLGDIRADRQTDRQTTILNSHTGRNNETQ